MYITTLDGVVTTAMEVIMDGVAIMATITTALFGVPPITDGVGAFHIGGTAIEGITALITVMVPIMDITTIHTIDLIIQEVMRTQTPEEGITLEQAQPLIDIPEQLLGQLMGILEPLEDIQEIQMDTDRVKEPALEIVAIPTLPVLG